MIQIFDPVAEEVTCYYSLRNDVGGLDRSPPSKKGHCEMGPSAAKDFLSMPFYVRKLLEIQQTFAVAMEQHLKMIRELRDLVYELRVVVKHLGTEEK
jgi:hypothetical protein